MCLDTWSVFFSAVENLLPPIDSRGSRRDEPNDEKNVMNLEEPATL